LDNLQAGQSRALMDLPDGGSYEFIEGDLLDPSVLRVALRDVDGVAVETGRERGRSADGDRTLDERSSGDTAA